MRPSAHGLAALAASLALCSCTTEVPVFPPSLSVADSEIAAALYAGAPRTPPGFAADAAPASFAQVTTYHIKSSQVAAPAATLHELCSDDWTAALAWSEEVAAQASPYLDLVATDTTPRWFEFGRVPRGEPTQYVRMRVLRCAYLDRTGVDLGLETGYAGTLNVRPLDAAALRNLVEYLWLFTPYNNAGHAVVASAPRGPGLAHALTIATLERGAGTSACDRVTLREWTHEAVPATGLLTRQAAVVREFGVRRDGGTLAAC